MDDTWTDKQRATLKATEFIRDFFGLEPLFPKDEKIVEDEVVKGDT